MARKTMLAPRRARTAKGEAFAIQLAREALAQLGNDRDAIQAFIGAVAVIGDRTLRIL